MTSAEQDAIQENAFFEALKEGRERAKNAHGIAGTAPLEFSEAFSGGFCAGWDAALALMGLKVSSVKTFRQEAQPTEAERIMQIAAKVYGQELAQ